MCSRRKRRTQPPMVVTNGGMQSGSSARNTCTLRTRFCTLGTDSYAQSVLSSKISVPELSRKFVKSALLVGEEKEANNNLSPVRSNKIQLNKAPPSPFLLARWFHFQERKCVPGPKWSFFSLSLSSPLTFHFQPYLLAFTLLKGSLSLCVCEEENGRRGVEEGVFCAV